MSSTFIIIIDFIRIFVFGTVARIRGEKSLERACVASILKKHSFKIPASDQRKIGIALFYFVSSTKMLFRNNSKKPDENAECIIYDISNRSFNRRRKFLNLVLGEVKNYKFVEFEEYPFFPKPQKAVIWIGMLLSFPFIFVLSLLFPKYRGNIAYLLLEAPRVIGIVSNFKLMGCKEIYFFSSYEKDANLLSYLFMNRGIQVTRIPSTNPIKIHYQRVVANRFFFTSKSQEEEFEILEKNWYVDEAKFKLFEEFESYFQVHNSESKGSQKYEFAFLSQGNWLREELGFNLLNEKDRENESTILGELKKLVEGTQLKILILLHPLEKKSEENYQKAIAHYTSISRNFIIANREDSSYTYFSNIDLCFSQISSSGLVRLYNNGKLIYADFSNQNYFGGTKLEKITAKDTTELKALIEKIKDMKFEKYITQFDLKPYTFNEDSTFINYLSKMNK